MATTTFLELINDTYSVLGVGSDSVNFPLVKVKRTINDLVSRVINGTVYSLIEFDRQGNPKKLQAGDLPFREKRKLYLPVQTSNLTEDTTTANTELPMDTETYLEPGAVMVGGEVITYETLSATELEDISTPQISHKNGDRVFPLYELPTDISKPYTLFRIDASGVKQPIPPQDSRQRDQYVNFFSIVTDNTGKNWLYIQGNNYHFVQDRNLLLIYYAKATEMVDNDDECIIPGEYTAFIPSLVAAQLNRDQEEVDEARAQALKGERGLNEMYQYFNNQTKTNKSRIYVTPPDFNNIT